MNPCLDALVAALFVGIDDLLAESPGWAPRRPAAGVKPKPADAGLVALAAVSALLGFDSESRFVRCAEALLRAWFPYPPDRAGLARAGQTLIADKGCRSAASEARLARASITATRPANKKNPPAPAPGSRDRCARSSNQTTTPSKPSPASNTTAAAPKPAPPRASPPAPRPSPSSGVSQK